MSLNRSTLYYEPKGESEENLQLMRRLDEQFLKTPYYGSRQMVYHLKRRGGRVGRKRVRRLMAKMGLAVIYQKPRTSRPHPENRVYPYLLRGLAVTRELLSIGVEKHQAAFSSGTWLTGTPLTYLAPW